MKHGAADPSPPEPKDHRRNRPPRWRDTVVAASAAAVAYLVFRALAAFPEATEVLLADGRAAWPARILSALTGWTPLSIAEVGLFLWVGWAAWRGARALLDVRLGDRSVGNALAGGAARLVRDAGILVVLGYLFWGFNYARPGLAARGGWPGWEGANAAELTTLADWAVEAANREYVAVHGSEDGGVPTAWPVNPDAAMAALGEGWQGVADAFPAEAEAFRGDYGRIKRPLLTGVLGRLGVSGVYAPWTGEPHVLRGMPAVAGLQSMAHEQAHQRGITNEAEAGFAGFLAGISAPEPVVRYSSAVYASRHLLSALRRTDPDAWERIAQRRHPGIRRDLEDLNAFWDPFRGVGQQIGAAVNDRYLRANRVAGGVTSYGQVVRLLVEWDRQGRPAGDRLPR